MRTVVFDTLAEYNAVLRDLEEAANQNNHPATRDDYEQLRQWFNAIVSMSLILVFDVRDKEESWALGSTMLRIVHAAERFGFNVNHLAPRSNESVVTLAHRMMSEGR